MKLNSVLFTQGEFIS